MHLNDTILEVIKKNLNEEWMSDSYNWSSDFVNLYCSNWFYTAEDCFYAIHNDAMAYSSMLYFTSYHGHDYISTLDMFNAYIYLYAIYVIEEHPEIRSHIRNLKIKQMRTSQTNHATYNLNTLDIVNSKVG